jgi:hypothetical protein
LVGGASVGCGAGWEVVPPAVGWEPVGCEVCVLAPELGAAGPDAPGDGAGWPELGDADDGTLAPALADGPVPAAVLPADDCVPADVVAT